MKVNHQMQIWFVVGANDLDAYIPEVWAQESLMILESNMVIANLVHRNFENLIASEGDIVNTRQPATFNALRKTKDDDVTDQDATATNVPVKLDQHIHTTFVIKDEDLSKSFKDLVAEFLAPAVLSIAELVDQVVACQLYAFKDNSVGRLGVTTTRTNVIDLKELLTNNRVPLAGRNLVVTPNTEGAMLDIDSFLEADKVGDGGTALRAGSIGTKLGMQTFTCQNMPSVSGHTQEATGTINNGNIIAGTTVFTVDGLSAAITNGSWITIAGDDTPLMVNSTAGGSTPTTITVYGGSKRAVVDGAVVTVWDSGAVNLGAGYATGYNKAIVTDAMTAAPKVGQLVSFAETQEFFGSVGVPTTTALDINRSVETALADDDVVGLGPDGEFNFAFHRNALALVVRPLALPPAGTGAKSFVANFNGLSIRITMTYDGKAQGLRVTCDLLCGVKVLNTALGAVMYG